MQLSGINTSLTNLRNVENAVDGIEQYAYVCVRAWMFEQDTQTNCNYSQFYLLESLDVFSGQSAGLVWDIWKAAESNCVFILIIPPH